MTYDEAKELLRNEDMLEENGDLSAGCAEEYLHWHRGAEVELDGTFTVQVLEAIAVYVKGTPRK